MKATNQSLVYLLITLFLLISVKLFSQSKIVDEKIFSSYVESKLTVEQMKYYKDEKNNEANKKVKLFKLTKTPSELSNAATIYFDIFDKEYYFKITETKTNRDESISLVGLTNGNELFLTIDGNDITASLSIDNKTYTIIPIGDKIHVLLEIDSSKYKPEEEPLKVKELKEDKDVIEMGEQIPSGDSDVDILVAYTPAASSVVSNMSTLINNAISQANYSFNEGGIDVTYHLVHNTEINIIEGTKNSETILNEFRNNSTISSLRNKYRADLCFLITNSDSVSGIA